MTLRLVDGVYEELVDNSPMVYNALTAAGGPLYPPDDWFQNPKLSRPTPITITADGKIYGHIAPWEVSHIGLPPGTKPPRSQSNYAFFRTGMLKTDAGNEVPVGQITLAGGHAPLNADAGAAVQHYDDTASAVADVACGEDEHGIWVSGGLRPGVSEEQIRSLRASAPSGDWRPINNGLELVAVCQVNTPGFPVARAMVASGELTALVAAGAAAMYELQREAGVMEALQSVAARVADLESVVAGGQRVADEQKTDDGNWYDNLTPIDQKPRLYSERVSESTDEAVTAAAPAAGPDMLRVTYDDGRNVLLVLTPDDTVNDSYDSREMKDTDQDGLGIDTQSKRQPKPDLREQGVMRDVGDGNSGMKTMDQGPNGSRMDGDGDFDGDADPSIPVVHNTDARDRDRGPEFNHTIDQCDSNCTNPAHGRRRIKADEDEGLTSMAAAGTKGSRSTGAVDDPDNGSRDGNDDSAPTDADTGEDVTNDTEGGVDRDIDSGRLNAKRHRRLKMMMDKQKMKTAAKASGKPA
jgi:hypothetical protein